MSRSRILAAAVALALSGVACKHADDPLEPFRKQCTDLQTQGSLKPGLTIDACAQSMKETSDADDPVRRAEELAGRIQALIDPPGQAADAGKILASKEDLRIAITEAEALGKPAAPVLQAHLEASHDPDVRIAFAKALVGICFDDCAQQKFDCIVPALLEGTTSERPAEVRQASIQGLMRCTGKAYGDDPAAWTSWWASVKAHP